MLTAGCVLWNSVTMVLMPALPARATRERRKGTMDSLNSAAALAPSLFLFLGLGPPELGAGEDDSGGGTGEPSAFAWFPLFSALV